MRLQTVIRYRIDGQEFDTTKAAEKHIENRLGAHVDKATAGLRDALNTVAQSGCITGPASEMAKLRIEVFDYLRANAADIAALLTADLTPDELDD